MALPLPPTFLCIVLLQEKSPSPERVGNKANVMWQFTDSQHECSPEKPALFMTKVLLGLCLSVTTEYSMLSYIWAGRSVPRA